MSDLLNSAFDFEEDEKEELFLLRFYLLVIVCSFIGFLLLVLVISSQAQKTITIETNQKIKPDETRIRGDDTTFVYKITF